MKAKVLAEIWYFVAPETLTAQEREIMADLLSGYAADIRKGQTGLPVGHRVQFSMAEG